MTQMQAHATPVLMVTQNPALWQHWQQVTAADWAPVRGQTLEDLAHWKQQGHGLAVLDAQLPHAPQWQETAWQAHLQGLKVLVLCARPSDEEGHQALSQGAAGYAHAYTQTPVLERVLQSIEAGNIWMGRSLLQRLLHDVGSRLPSVQPAPAAAPAQTPASAAADWTQTLTLREQEIARHAAVGESNQAIAERLNITERTVRAHLSAIFDKLQVSDRLMLALKVHGICP